MLYTYTNVTSFSGANGCPGHDETADPTVEHFAVECPRCEPYLAALPFWAVSPDEVPLTKADRLAQARVEREMERQRIADYKADQELIREERQRRAAAAKAQPTPAPKRAAKKAPGRKPAAKRSV